MMLQLRKIDILFALKKDFLRPHPTQEGNCFGGCIHSNLSIWQECCSQVCMLIRHLSRATHTPTLKRTQQSTAGFAPTNAWQALGLEQSLKDSVHVNLRNTAQFRPGARLKHNRELCARLARPSTSDAFLRAVIETEAHGATGWLKRPRGARCT